MLVENVSDYADVIGKKPETLVLELKKATYIK